MVRERSDGLLLESEILMCSRATNMSTALIYGWHSRVWYNIFDLALAYVSLIAGLCGDN